MTETPDTAWVVKRGYRWRPWWLFFAGFDLACLVYATGWGRLYWLALTLYMMKPSKRRAENSTMKGER